MILLAAAGLQGCQLRVASGRLLEAGRISWSERAKLKPKLYCYAQKRSLLIRIGLRFFVGLIQKRV